MDQTGRGSRSAFRRALVAGAAALLSVACGGADAPGADPSSGRLVPRDAEGPAGTESAGKGPSGSGGTKDPRRSKPARKALPREEAAVKGSARTRATVTDVVDGDTIAVSRPAGTENVRLIGVDTPETVHPTEPVGCYGQRASDFTTHSLYGERVRLEFDDERRDHYGRLLAYVWLEGRLFNKQLVARGFAEVTIYAPNDEYEGVLYAAQARARSDDRGMWGACPRGAGPKSGPKEVAPAPGGKNCDSNYKGACVPVYPPDLDCSDVPKTNFRSVGNDPHGFDGDGDGVACEG